MLTDFKILALLDSLSRCGKARIPRRRHRYRRRHRREDRRENVGVSFSLP